MTKYFIKYLYNFNLPHVLIHKLIPFSELSFGQKIKHKMRFDKREILTIFSDKVQVKERVSDRIGYKYVVPNYAVLDNALDLEFSEYPREFVLKPSHASGAGFIIHEGAKRISSPLKNDGKTWGPYYEIHPDDLGINAGFIEEKSTSWLNSIYAPGKGFGYQSIPPRLIVEKYIPMHFDVERAHDFRFYTFHGKVKFFRALPSLNPNIPNFTYDEYGKPLNVKLTRENHNFRGLNPVLPNEYQKMISLAEILSEDIDFVRVDLYLIEGKIYFSELTNYPFSGNLIFSPESYDRFVSGFWESFDECGYLNR